MRIIVNHLTRLRLGDICVAGIDEATEKHVRPVAGLLRPRMLRSQGGFFEIGCLVDLGRVKSVADPPHVEDWEFKPRKAKLVCEVLPDEFRELLETAAKDSVRELFGDDIHPIGRGGAWGTDEGKGTASLGCLRVTSRCRLYLKPRGNRPQQPRLSFRQNGDDYDLGVTDIRLYDDARVHPVKETVARVGQQLQKGGPVILSVGLTRSFSSSMDFPAQHWLQVNNIHLPDNPCWRLS